MSMVIQTIFFKWQWVSLAFVCFHKVALPKNLNYASAFALHSSGEFGVGKWPAHDLAGPTEGSG